MSSRQRLNCVSPREKPSSMALALRDWTKSSIATTLASSVAMEDFEVKPPCLKIPLDKRFSPYLCKSQASARVSGQIREFYVTFFHCWAPAGSGNRTGPLHGHAAATGSAFLFFSRIRPDARTAVVNFYRIHAG